jgi:hypothetical protein
MATWARPDLDFAFTTDSGVVAFGQATPASAVPLAGTATYEGVLAGLTDAKYPDPSNGVWGLRNAGGTVTLQFDFARSTLNGSMALSVSGDMNPIAVGTFPFAQTVLGSGTGSYSGKFDTSLAGFNFFNGLLTGPHAEETIGNWGVPFQFDGQTHQANGAWMAKKP